MLSDVAPTSVDPPLAAWDAFRRAAQSSAGYRHHLTARAVDPDTVDRWDAVPVITKQDVFAEDPQRWSCAGRIDAVAEIVCSSGQSGPPVAIGLVSEADRDEMTDRVDGMLSELGAGPDSSTLLVNLLPMGISVPTRLATVASPCAHIEMAMHVMTRVAPQFDRVVVVGEPLFVAELARRLAGRAPDDLWLFVGGEPVAASWRTYVCGLLGIEPYRVVVSFGAAELGLHLLFETPNLAAARAVCAADPSQWAGCAWNDVCMGQFTPTLMAHDPRRVFIETPVGSDGRPRLTITTLGTPLLPLVRYDLGDVAMVLDEVAVARLSARTAIPLTAPIVAVVGRAAGLPLPDGGRICPEAVRELLFGDDTLADAVTGRFRLRHEPTGVVCHVQARRGMASSPRPAAACTRLAEGLTAIAGSPVEVVWHADDYPFHEHDDWTHKPVYAEVAA